MKLRSYQSCDFDAIIQIWWESWHSSSGYKHHRPISDWKQRWHNLVKTHTIVVMDHHDEVIAFAALNTQVCVLSQLFVSPHWKRKGIGKQLMQWVAVQCPDGFTLKTATDNQESRTFYDTLGMVETGRSINDFNGREEIEYSTEYGSRPQYSSVQIS